MTNPIPSPERIERPMPRDPRFWLISALLVVFFFGLGFYVVPRWSQWFQTPQQRIGYLYESVWCPVCEGETVGTSQTQVSRELRATIARMVREGKSNAAIYDHVEDNYGPDMVAVPRRGWSSRLSYGVPYLALGVVSVFLFALGWRWVEAGRAAHDEEADGELSEETRSVLDELAHRQGPLG